MAMEYCRFLSGTVDIFIIEILQNYSSSFLIYYDTGKKLLLLIKNVLKIIYY
jgi:hypothetical protein